jgi:hypothetical protein
MPTLSIKTNVDVPTDVKKFLKALSSLIAAELGKPDESVSLFICFSYVILQSSFCVILLLIFLCFFFSLKILCVLVFNFNQVAQSVARAGSTWPVSNGAGNTYS